MVKYKESELDLVFGALSDVTRRKIIEKLSGEDLIVTQIASEFDMSLPAVSKHIKVLEKAGLVNRKKDGKVHKISYNRDAVDKAWKWIERYRKFWEKSFDSLEKYLDKQTKGDK